MVTIKDVAMRAGVSVGTASRVASKNPAVKTVLRMRVEAAMKDMGYKPNLAARVLRTNRADIIGLVLPDITNPFFAQLAKDVEMAAAEVGLSVMLANSLGQAHMEAVRVEAILDQSPRGIIVISSSDTAEIPTREGIYCVALDRPSGAFPHVSIDNALSAGLAVDHLHGLGHRRIAYIAGPRDTSVARQREAGFLRRVMDLSTPHNEIALTVREGLFDYVSGETIGRALLSPNRQRITAIAAASDQQAIGVIRAARDLGIQVPGELSVVGHDDIALADLVVPRLTTIRQPTELMARCAVALILEAGEDRRNHQFLAELVIRVSTGFVPEDCPASEPRWRDVEKLDASDAM